MRRQYLFAAVLLPLALAAQTPPPRKARPAPTGLKVLSTTIDPTTRAVTVQVQNTTEKTIVGYSIFYNQFSADNRPLGGGGIITDRNGPDNPDHADWISPGQLAAIRDGYSVAPDPDVVLVEAKVTAVMFDDDTTAGEKTHVAVMSEVRRNRAKQAREQAAKESGEKKAELERKAEWFEAHSPKEAQ